MRKFAFVVVLMQPLVFTPFASAQAPQPSTAQASPGLIPNADTRVSLVKAALQLTPEQE